MPAVGSSGSSMYFSFIGKSRSHKNPSNETMTNAENVKTMIAIGSDSVRPYKTEMGLNKGAVNPKAMIVPPLIPTRCISRTTGMTPREQTGKSMPTNQPMKSPNRVPSPKSNRVLDGPSICLNTLATKQPMAIQIAALITTCDPLRKTHE